MSEHVEMKEMKVDEIPMDCIDTSIIMNWLIVKDEHLWKIESMINEKMKWIICRRCDRAVSPKHLQTHIHKHNLNCSHDIMQSIISHHGLKSFKSIKEFKDGNWTLDISINDISLKEKGYKCLKCWYYDPWWMIDVKENI